VLSEWWDTVQVVANSLTQFRTTTEGRPIGLIYSEVERVAGWLGIALDKESFAMIRAMEAEMVNVLNG